MDLCKFHVFDRNKNNKIRKRERKRKNKMNKKNDFFRKQAKTYAGE